MFRAFLPPSEPFFHLTRATTPTFIPLTPWISAAQIPNVTVQVECESLDDSAEEREDDAPATLEDRR